MKYNSKEHFQRSHIVHEFCWSLLNLPIRINIILKILLHCFHVVQFVCSPASFYIMTHIFVLFEPVVMLSSISILKLSPTIFWVVLCSLMCYSDVHMSVWQLCLLFYSSLSQIQIKPTAGRCVSVSLRSMFVKGTTNRKG